MPVCDECGFDWDADGSALISEIGQLGGTYGDRIARALDGDVDLGARPAPHVWSMLEYSAHMRDVADFYRGRIEAVLSFERPQMHAVGFSSLAEQRRYRDDDIRAVLTALDRHASDVANRLASLSAEQWRRVGVGSEGDERSILVLARRLAHDGHHHLLDLDRVSRVVSEQGER